MELSFSHWPCDLEAIAFCIIFSSISIFYVLLDVTIWLFYLINVIEYSVNVPFRQDKYFLTLLCFCEFSRFRLAFYAFLLQ